MSYRRGVFLPILPIVSRLKMITWLGVCLLFPVQPALAQDQVIIDEERTLGQVVSRYAPEVRKMLIPAFAFAAVPYPPPSVTLLVMKDRHTIELWAEAGEQAHYIKRYYIWSASGKSGPKLVEGDKQVPEGFYQVTALNPGSKYHLSLGLDYPNAFDLKWAQAEGRLNPGSDIFIHGKSSSAGCLAMGDKNIQELFILANDVGVGNMRVIIAPSDPRNLPLKVPPGAADWVATLYQQLEAAFAAYRH